MKIKITLASLLLLSMQAVQANDMAPFDVDRNGVEEALTDGLLIIRHLFGFTGEALCNNAVASDSPLTCEEIEERMYWGTPIINCTMTSDIITCVFRSK